MLIEEKDICLWRDDIQDYNRQRRDRGYENPKVERVSQKTVKDKEKIFDPLLQIYNDPKQDANDLMKTKSSLQIAKEKKNKHLEKYVKDFDIINLEKLNVQIIPEKTYTKSVIKPSVREFNIITNSALEKYMYENVKVLKQEKIIEKKADLSRVRDFNIISNKYTDNHDTKIQNDEEKNNNKLHDKYRKTHKYNFVNGICYDPEMEKQYQDNLKEKNLNHGKDAILKLPPSLRYRETVIFDRNKPIPEELKLLDLQRENAKKRYQLRYAIENEYHERNIEAQDRRQQRILNGLCEQKYLDEHKKGFDLITLDRININDIEKLINKKPNLSSWDKIQITKKDEFSTTDYSGFGNTKDDIKYNDDGKYEDRQSDHDSKYFATTNNLRINDPGKISLPSINNNQNSNDHQEIFGDSQQQNLRTGSHQNNNNGDDQQFYQTANLDNASQAQRQSRRRKSGLKHQQKFEENTFGLSLPKSKVEKSSRGSIISTESNQNKFRIKTGGFNA